jgi:hypothetical protein
MAPRRKSYPPESAKIDSMKVKVVPVTNKLIQLQDNLIAYSDSSDKESEESSQGQAYEF